MLRGHVLIASDGALAGRWIGGLESQLADRQVGVCRTWTGPSAVDFVRRGGIDLAVLGFEPPASGLAALRLIRTIDQMLPCMLVAREAPKPILRQALHLGVSSVLTEPIDLGFMTTLIARLLNQTLNTAAPGRPRGGFSLRTPEEE